MMFDTCTIVPALLHVLVLGLFAVFVTADIFGERNVGSTVSNIGEVRR